VARSDDRLHIHGPFKPPLLAATVVAARIRRRRVSFSPHNTFSRQNRLVDAELLRWAARCADATFVYSTADAAVVRGWGARPVVSFLLQYVPAIDEAERARWRARWRGSTVVLFAGQVRRDKRLDLLIEASRVWRSGALLAVVGRDAGDAEHCRLLAERLGAEVDWTLEYVPLPSFLAAIAAADVVSCPYGRASQSGVLAAAAQLGTPTVATAVGGLAELATVVVPPVADARALAQAIDAALEEPRRAPISPETEAVAAHRRGYGLPAA
jgi:glycosyltransferase involved in cell wall biosynthesis